MPARVKWRNRMLSNRAAADHSFRRKTGNFPGCISHGINRVGDVDQHGIRVITCQCGGNVWKMATLSFNTSARVRSHAVMRQLS